MGKIRVVALNEAQRKELEVGLRDGASHAFRKRCQTVLLKSEGRSSREVAAIVKMHQVSVNEWANRYETEGIAGLHTKPGRGRKPYLDKEKDGPGLIDAVKANRQSLKAARGAFEAARADAPSVSDDTLRRFLKALTDDTKG